MESPQESLSATKISSIQQFELVSYSIQELLKSVIESSRISKACRVISRASKSLKEYPRASDDPKKKPY